MKPIRPVLRLLEKAFAAEMEGRLPLQVRESRAVARAMEDGLIARSEVMIGDGWPLAVSGFALTDRGRILWCEYCAEKEEGRVLEINPAYAGRRLCVALTDRARRRQGRP